MPTRPPLRVVDGSPPRPVVIVGAGFGGLAAARALGKRGITVTLIDRQNHHLFQPLLYQVATAALSPADIAAPIRAIVRDRPSVRVLMDEVTGVDTAARIVRTAAGAAISYAALIVATGARHGYFGRDDWAEHARGIKTLEDAVGVRHDILWTLEREETRRQEHPAARHAPLTFAIIGGGPTGVEMAGAVIELTRHVAMRDFPNISRDCVKVVLIQGGPRLLPGFPATLSRAAQRSLGKLGVRVLLDSRVTAIDAGGVNLGETRIDTAVTIWAAGVMASPAARWLGVEADRSGRVPVDADLAVPGLPGVYAIGDTALVTDVAGRIAPGVAAAAKQQGEHVAETVIAALAGRPPATRFRYRDRGNLATIGRSHAVAYLGRIRLSGLTAWLLWVTAHLWFLVGFRNRFVVGAAWMWSYLTRERGVRLITDCDAPRTIAVTRAATAAK